MENEVKNNAMHIVIILDKSGSMASLGKEAVEGVNDFLSKQKENPGEDLYSLCLFNNELEVKADSIPLKDAKPLDESSYNPRGTTALLDAIGTFVSRVEERKEKGLFVIMTDGKENASSKYSYFEIKGKISELEKEGWKFIFLSSGIEARAEGEKLSFSLSFNGTREKGQVRRMFCCAKEEASLFRKQEKK